MSSSSSSRLINGNLVVAQNIYAAGFSSPGPFPDTNLPFSGIFYGRGDGLVQNSIPRNSLTIGTPSYVVINDTDGSLSEEQFLSSSRGGTGIDARGTSGIAHVSAAGNWSISKLVTGDINATNFSLTNTQLQMGTDNSAHVVTVDTNGYLSSEQYLSTARGGFGLNITGSTGAVKISGTSIFVAPITSTDVATDFTVGFTSITTGTNTGPIFADTNSGILLSESYLSPSRGGTGFNPTGSTGILKVAGTIFSVSPIASSDLGTNLIPASYITLSPPSSVVLTDTLAKLTTAPILAITYGGSGTDFSTSTGNNNLVEIYRDTDGNLHMLANIKYQTNTYPAPSEIPITDTNGTLLVNRLYVTASSTGGIYFDKMGSLNSISVFTSDNQLVFTKYDGSGGPPILFSGIPQLSSRRIEFSQSSTVLTSNTAPSVSMVSIDVGNGGIAGKTAALIECTISGQSLSDSSGAFLSGSVRTFCNETSALLSTTGFLPMIKDADSALTDCSLSYATSATRSLSITINSTADAKWAASLHITKVTSATSFQS
jgi:hypothetical protein